MSQTPKLDDMTREQAIAKLKALLVHFNRLRNVRIKDLPFCARANERHQAMKRKWAEKKKRLLDLLSECLPYVSLIAGQDTLRAAIKYELDHDEDLWQKHMANERATKAARKRGRVPA